MGLQGLDGIGRLITHDVRTVTSITSDAPRMSGLGRRLLMIAGAGAALYGAAKLLQDRGGERFIGLDREPDLSPVDKLPLTDEAARRTLQYSILQEHFATYGAPVTDALQGMVEAGILIEYTPRLASNGYSVEIASGQGNEFREAIKDVPNILAPISGNLAG